MRETRERRGWTQGELAERVGLHRTAINKIENGSRGDVAIGQLFTFAYVLQIAPVYLLTPRGNDANVKVDTPDGAQILTPSAVRRWIRGSAETTLFRELPRDEQHAVLFAAHTEGFTPIQRRLLQKQIDERIEGFLDTLEHQGEDRHA